MRDEDSREFLLRDNCGKDGMIESGEMLSFFLSIEIRSPLFVELYFSPLFARRIEIFYMLL